jgi:acyl-CoA synthetase (AMP-forming)/AMP-acid ligase II
MFVSFNELFKTNFLCYLPCLVLSYKEKSYSYKELNRQANRFAYYLKQQDIKKITIVTIIPKNYLEKLIYINSLWWLETAYLPVDLNYLLTLINTIVPNYIAFLKNYLPIFENS